MLHSWCNCLGGQPDAGGKSNSIVGTWNTVLYRTRFFFPQAKSRKLSKHVFLTTIVWKFTQWISWHKDRSVIPRCRMVGLREAWLWMIDVSRTFWLKPLGSLGPLSFSWGWVKRTWSRELYAWTSEFHWQGWCYNGPWLFWSTSSQCVLQNPIAHNSSNLFSSCWWIYFRSATSQISSTACAQSLQVSCAVRYLTIFTIIKIRIGGKYILCC